MTPVMTVLGGHHETKGTGTGPVRTVTAPIDALMTVGAPTIINVLGAGATITVTPGTGLVPVQVTPVTVGTVTPPVPVPVAGLGQATGPVTGDRMRYGPRHPIVRDQVPETERLLSGI